MRSNFQWDQAFLYGILDAGYVPQQEFVSCAKKLIACGVSLLQLRAKGFAVDEIASHAAAILPVCRSAGVPLIVNDHPEVAAQCGADGVHVGQEDCSVADARRILGPGRIVGKSTHGVDQALAAQAEQPDYIGFGPLFATPTKPDYQPIGLDSVVAVHRLVSIPVFCIGGIHLKNLAQVLQSGAKRVVIVSALLLAADIEAYGRACLGMLRDHSP